MNEPKASREMTSAEKKQQERQFDEMRRNMKSFLKQKSKNELINIVFQQVDLYNDQRQALKQLAAELEQLRNPKDPQQQPIDVTKEPS